MNPLVELFEHKQSFWLDFIRRDLMTSGELKQMVESDGLRGMTSNPTIFQKAIATSDEYDASLIKHSKGNKTVDEVFEALAIEDIQKAADVLKPIYQSSQAQDGYVSLEVNPNLAFDTQGTLNEAKKLFKAVKRPNLMIKIPGTLEGLPAIEEATFLGINVNVTLLFSVDLYKKVLDAHIKGLERRARKKKPISKMASVASFFVSRVDTIIDKQLDALVAEGGSKGEAAAPLLHKIAIANAKLAYAHYEKVIRSPRFKKLAKKGVQAQRLLWASTGTKDKRMSDVVYVEELIGPDTVNTMPPATAEAFKDHGSVAARLQSDVAQARKDVAALSSLGINLKAATDTLQKAGVKSFIQSYNELIQVVCAKKEKLTGTLDKQLDIQMGSLADEYKKNLGRLSDENWVERIWKKDAALWKTDADHQKIIKNALGWLTVTDTVASSLKILDDLAQSVKKDRFTHILLLGMGGSSLAPEVLRLTFGRKSGAPDFAILDSTEPGSVLERASWSKPEKTLYIVASKSGSTTEPNVFFSYFYNQVKKKKGAKAGQNFVAITDPGTQMEALAKKKKFRAIILNPADIGGRYSALSFFGMTPAALMGLNVPDIVQRARTMAGACSSFMEVDKNPGALLGTAIGTAARNGRNKVTFFLSKDIGSFGTWLEQLLAESTGKEGTGLLPVESEAPQAPSCYESDRVFVSIRTKKAADRSVETKIKELEKAGHPTIRIVLNDKADIAAEFFRWEFATAVVGALLDINPFDQPNVQQAKDLTKQLLSEYNANGGFPSEIPLYQDGSFFVYGSNGVSQQSSLTEAVRYFLNQAEPQDYVALLAYLTRNKTNEKILQDIRHAILKRKKVATTIGFGPRYLHSTGQYHKGGDNHGLFISLTADDPKDVPIPGQSFSYSILKEAQARGDWGALKEKDRRILHIHMKDTKKGLLALKKVIDSV